MRLFTAIELNERLREGLARAQRSLARFDRAVRWVKPENIHLTLVFLGDVADARVPAVCDAVARAASRVGPFDFTVSGSGCFPTRGRVNVVWTGVGAVDQALVRCQSACADELVSIGFPRESRPYSPHLTLGRVKDDSTGGALRKAVEELAFAPMTQAADSIRVIQSRLTPSGPIYTTVAVYPLTGRGTDAS